jgi:hypothetical protein
VSDVISADRRYQQVPEIGGTAREPRPAAAALDGLAQFTLALRGNPIVTSRNEEKLAALHDLGVTNTINYRTTPDIAHEVSKLTQA